MLTEHDDFVTQIFDSQMTDKLAFHIQALDPGALGAYRARCNLDLGACICRHIPRSSF